MLFKKKNLAIVVLLRVILSFTLGFTKLTVAQIANPHSWGDLQSKQEI